jgi:plasmid stability protein
MGNAVRIVDASVIRLIRLRAAAEHRSAANAAGATILEALLPIYGEPKEPGEKIRAGAEAVKDNN